MPRSDRAVQHPVHDVASRIDDRPATGADLLHRVIVEWNRTTLAYDVQQTVWSLFEAQAVAQPSRIAVIDGHDEIDRSRLRDDALVVAGALAARGVKPGALVGVCMRRSASLVATLLGVLRAGCAYVPLDPDYPRERVRYMLDHAQAAAVIVDDEAAEELCAGVPVRIRLDALDGHRVEPAASPTAEDLAYVIYTSGSTGTPKGVAVSHRNVHAMICAMRQLLDDEALSGVLAAASICFDTSVMEILGTLALGGTAVLADNALALPDLPAASRVRTTIMVPASMQALLAIGGLPPGVRCVVCGGDVLKRPLLERLHALPQQPRVLNLYGPTEDTVFSTAAEVPPGVETITIGRPVANARAYILDTAMRPVPVGVDGELHLAGDHLARGYLHDDARTRERFVELDAGGPIPDRRLYRTGDRCRWTRDGEIEFLGRLDQQVKLRGFRIELEEIEAVLESMPGVHGAAAAVHESGDGKGRLVGYVEGDVVSDAAVRAHAAHRLPGFMVPQVIVRLPAIPRLPNGKLDRRRLPDPVVAGAGVAEPGAEQIERARPADMLALVREEFARFLRLDDPARVQPHHTLDALGLDSLDAVELGHRLSTVLGRPLPASLLVDLPTVAAVADHLADGSVGNGGDAPAAATPVTSDETLARFQQQLRAGHPPFLAARAPAWSATDKGALIMALKRLLVRAGREPYSTLVRTGSGHRGTVADVHTGEAHEAIIWSTNLYLGLNRDPDVIAQARDALERFGSGMGTSPTASGMTDLHLDFEKEFAALVGKPAGGLFSTGFTANLGVIAGLLGDKDVVVMDQLCHASIVDGARLSGARIRTFKHNDAADLDAVLAAEASPHRTVLVVLEGVYSMGEGSAPVREIVRTAKHHGALVLVDEAHSFGFYGPRGAGICAEQGVTGQVDFIMTTLSKALGSLGGVIAASEAHMALLKTSARAYVFQATTTPADIAAALAALRRLRDDDALRTRLWDTTRYMRARFADAGYDLCTGDGPIVTPHVSDSEVLYAIARGLHARGIHATAVTYPIVERGRGRLRFICSAAHSREDVDRTLATLVEVQREVEQARQRPMQRLDAAHAPSGSANAASADITRRAGEETHLRDAGLDAWSRGFAAALADRLADREGPMPHLAVVLETPDPHERVILRIDGCAVTLDDQTSPCGHPACTLMFSTENALSALRAYDASGVLDACIQGGCDLGGQIEPFVWFVARLVEIEQHTGSTPG